MDLMKIREITQKIMQLLQDSKVNAQEWEKIDDLYKKYGFETLGKRKNYYNNQDDAYIMTKYISK